MTSFSPGFWMHQEILEQPDVLARVLALEASPALTLGAKLKSRGVRLVVIAARGSSDHAAILAKYLFEWALGVPVALAAPSVATLYHRPMSLKGTLVLGISQSGRSPDVVEYVRRARRGGALTAAITNDAGSPLAKTAREILLCHAGEERSVVATKTFLAELACVYLVTAAWVGGRRGADLRRRIFKVAENLAEALKLESVVAESMGGWRKVDRAILLGRGFSYPIALEAALKFKEAAGIFAEGASAADFLHGPAGMLNGQSARTLRAILFIPEVGENVFPRAQEKFKAAHIVTTRIAPRKFSPRNRALNIILPGNVPDWLAPFSWTVIAQLAAYHLARVKRRNPDHPAGLSKITRTR